MWVDFLLPAHITGLAVAMLLYANENCAVIAFAAAVAIGSKAVFRAPLERRTRHFFNPSNLGITTTLLLFPWVGSRPPISIRNKFPRQWRGSSHRDCHARAVSSIISLPSGIR